MTKKTNDGFTNDFQSQIINLKNSYLLSFATIDLISNDNVLNILENDSFKCSGYKFPFKQISNLIRKSKTNNNNDFKILSWEYLMFCTRSFFISAYEAFKKDQNRYDCVKELDWFIFLANIRHSVAHGINATWDLKYYEKNEIFYTRKEDDKKIVINIELNGKPMKLEHFDGWLTIIDLLVFLEDYVKEQTKAKKF
ncbi:MAG: hypothetical protein GY804_09540 [Alphaproteobacteria bacterium]|nr:hypothetical protein [Alphaproteobacteria bacterium]